MSPFERSGSSTRTRPGPQLKNCKSTASSLLNTWPTPGVSLIVSIRNFTIIVFLYYVNECQRQELATRRRFPTRRKPRRARAADQDALRDNCRAYERAHIPPRNRGFAVGR